MTSRKAGTAVACATRLRRAIAVSCAEKLPCWNNVAINGSAHRIRPRQAGTPISRHSRKPQSSARENPCGSVEAWRPDRCGRITVPMATPNMPSGNSSSRSV